MASFQYGGLVEQVASTATAAGTTTLINTSKQIQVFTGATIQTIVLPDATTMSVGQKFEIYNESSASLTIQFNGGSAFTDAAGISYGTQGANTSLVVKLQTNGTALGTWAVTPSGGTATTISGLITSANVANSSFTAPSLQKFTSGSGTYKLNYVFTILSGNATVGATYTNNSITFTVYATVSSATQVVMSGSGAPTSSGTLTKASGTGDATLTFSHVRAPLYIRARMVGGGGGGSGSGTSGASNGGDGTASTFGSSLLSAGAGSGGFFQGAGGGGGTSSLGSGPVGLALTGGLGGGFGLGVLVNEYQMGGNGGNSAFGGAAGTGAANTAGVSGATNTGGGGSGGGSGSAVNVYGGSGGGSGGFIDAIIYSPSATYSYTVGGGGGFGGAGVNGFQGGSGASGIIEVTEYYQ